LQHYKEIIYLCTLEENLVASSSVDCSVIVWKYLDFELYYYGKMIGFSGVVQRILDMSDGKLMVAGDINGIY